MPEVEGDSTVQWTIVSVVWPECSSRTLGGDWWPKGKAELGRPQCTHFCWCLVPLILSHTSSSWLTAHLRSVYLAIPPHCLFGALATKSTHIWSIPPFQPSLSILMASLLLASRTMSNLPGWSIWPPCRIYHWTCLKSREGFGFHVMCK